MDVSEIVDRDSFEQWLKETNQPREVCVGLAHRAAMRVLPIAWSGFQNSPKAVLTALPILRCSLTSSGTYWQKVPEEVINAAAVDAAAYASLRRECQNILQGLDWLNQPLWDDTPGDISAIWLNLVQKLREEASRTNEAFARFDAAALDWTFFVEWYDRALQPTPEKPQFSEALLSEIIVSGSVDWDAKPAAVLDQINAIRSKHASRSTGMPERLARNPKTEKIEATELTDLPKQVLQDALHIVTDAVDDFRSDWGQTRNDIGPFEDILRGLHRIHQRHPESPYRLYLAYAEAYSEIETLCADDVTFANDRHVQRLKRALDGAALDILNSSDHVQTMVAGRVAQRILRLSEDHQDRLRALVDVATPEADDDLAEEMREDEEKVLDEEEEIKVRQTRAQRLGSRLMGIGQIKRDEAVSAAKDAADLKKGAEALGGAWKFLSEIYNWFL